MKKKGYPHWSPHLARGSGILRFPGKLAPEATDRAGMGPSCGPFVRISILRIDLPSHPFGELSRGRAFSLAGRGNWCKIVSPVSHMCALQEMRLMTYRFHRIASKFSRKGFPSRGGLFIQNIFDLYDRTTPQSAPQTAPQLHISAPLPP